MITKTEHGPPSGPYLAVSINGRTLESQEIELTTGFEHTIAVSFTREASSNDEWADVVLLLLSDEKSNTSSEIQFRKSIGLKKNERVKSGIATWSSQKKNSDHGRPFHINLPEGHYALRLCLHYQPSSIAEKKRYHEDPTPFLKPFFQSIVSVVEPE